MAGGSYKTINYSIRPAKCIERKMMCEAFQRLVFFEDLRRYRYVGLGSPFYTDFVLLHKRLGMRDMIDIEIPSEDGKRFKFNKPYNCIRIEFGHSRDVLPSLDYGPRTVFWMDYDGKLDASVLADIRTICTRAPSGSVLVLTVNADLYKKPKNVRGPRLTYSLEKMRQVIGQGLPRWINSRSGQKREMRGSDLLDWGTAAAYSRVMVNEIVSCLKDRNSGVVSSERMRSMQLFHFRYRDSARMLTMGWLLFAEKEREIAAQCRFDDISFVVPCGGPPVEIEVPSLTLKEVRHLNSQLPGTARSKISCPGVAPADVSKYAEVYRWFPTFAEAEV